MQEWRFVVKDRYPAYIDWATYEKIRSILSDNRAEYMRNKTRGAPRDGDMLLHGIVWCGRCGHKMFVRYKGGGEYVCNHLHTQRAAPVCQHIRADVVDNTVAQAFLAALAPAEIEALSQAHRARQKADRELRSAAEQQVERKRYQAALAERQYNKVDPDNRLVASELERRWEAALIELKMAEEALARRREQPSAAPAVIGKILTDKIVALSGRLPDLWHAPTTSDAQRKALLRCLIDKVVLERGAHDVATARVIWRGGAVSQLTVKLAVARLTALTRGAEMRERVIALARADMPDEEIAALLTSEGHRSPTCAERVLPVTVRRIRQQAGLGPRTPRSRWRHSSDLLGIHALARRLNIPAKWLYSQIRTGCLLIDRQPTGAYLFEDTEAVIQAVRNLRDRTVDRIDLRPHQPNYTGYQHA